MSFAAPELAQILSNTKAPYNISTPTSSLALQALSDEVRTRRLDGASKTRFDAQSIIAFHKKVAQLNKNRDFLVEALQSPELKSKGVGPLIGGQDANFLLVQIQNKAGQPDNDRAQKLYTTMAESEGVVVRFRGKELGCEGCLRITVGSREECEVVIKKLGEVLDTL
jgi:histidinol-phosphate aminotransferase